LLKHLAFQEVPYSDVCAHLVYLCVKEWQIMTSL
jgi:hypothetical protein